MNVDGEKLNEAAKRATEVNSDMRRGKAFKKCRQANKDFNKSLRSIIKKINSDGWNLVQIGAANGLDNIRPVALKYGETKNWNCLFVEPIKRQFQELKKTYKGAGFSFENSAIANKTGTLKMYRVTPAKRRFKEDRRASLIKSKFISDIAEAETGIEPKFKGFKVNGLTLSDLISKHELTSLDFLQTDCEGYDFEIIKQIDFSSTYRPKLICYEMWDRDDFKEGDDTSGQIELGPSTAAKCKEFLEANGYFIHSESEGCAIKNVLAVDASVILNE